MADKELRELFGRNLKHWLNMRGYKQADLSRHFGVSSATASDWCNGNKMPRADKLRAICSWLDIELSDLMTNSIVQADGQASEYHPDLSERELSHLTMYRTLSDPGKDRVDAYTEKVQSVEAEESDQQIVETFQKRFVARNGNKNLTPDQMRAIIDILDNQ